MVSPKAAPEPFDAEGKFKARNVLYTPLAFRRHRIGAITLESRFYFGSELPIEDAQWLYPFASQYQTTKILFHHFADHPGKFAIYVYVLRFPPNFF